MIKHTKQSIQELLCRSDKAVERAMVVLHEYQTADERQEGQTRWNNGVGFMTMHARRGTYYAKWVLSGKHLSGLHLVKAREIALKQAQQLANIANKKPQNG